MPRPVAPSLRPALDLAPARMLAELDRREGRKGEKIEHAFAALRSEPQDFELRCALAGRLALEERLDEAESQYREVTRLRSSFAAGNQGLGVIERWRGNVAAALPFFQRAAALDTNCRDE